MIKKSSPTTKNANSTADHTQAVAWIDCNRALQVRAHSRRRPSKQEISVPMAGKRVKLPTVLWNALKEQAKTQHMTINNLIALRLTGL